MTDGEREGTVQIAYLHRDNVSHSWHESMDGLRDYDREHGRYLRPGRPFGMRTHPIRMVQSRNIVAQAFLDATDAEWLFWVDTDMAWRPEALEQLMSVADPVTAPIVGGLCFGLWPTEYDGMGGSGMRFEVRPTLFQFGKRVSDGAERLSALPSYPSDTMVQVHATGSAFVLIHRTVLEKVRAEHGEHWYDQFTDGDGEVVGEDICFCLRAGALGVPMFVHTGIPTTHHKELWIGEQDFWAQNAERHLANPAPDLPLFTHLPATFAALAADEHNRNGMLKFEQDLERYAAVIEATQPEVIVETGTHTGASAQWFADHGVEVITIDVTPPGQKIYDDSAIRVLTGSSTDPTVIELVRDLVAGRRCMVSLDSNHSAAHVRREIEAYGPMVSPGCYLVVEDTVFGYGEDAKIAHGMGELVGSPLDAVLSHLVDNPAWSRDVAVEQSHPIGSNPAGWWVRNG